MAVRFSRDIVHGRGRHRLVEVAAAELTVHGGLPAGTCDCRAGALVELVDVTAELVSERVHLTARCAACGQVAAVSGRDSRVPRPRRSAAWEYETGGSAVRPAPAMIK